MAQQVRHVRVRQAGLVGDGHVSIVDEAKFDAERWYRILDEQKIDV